MLSKELKKMKSIKQNRKPNLADIIKPDSSWGGSLFSWKLLCRKEKHSRDNMLSAMLN